METVLLSPAKVNLFLRVIAKRPDGYHELETVMCPIDLCDEVVLSFDCPHIAVRCNHPDVPNGEKNIAYQAASRFFQAASLDNTGVDISIEKNIPVASGLGGGSSNAATVLKGLNNHYGNPLSYQELLDVGLEIGADVPLFIYGRAALATGVGEHLAPIREVPPMWAILVHPPIAISTTWVYENLNLRLTICEEKYNVSWFLEDFSEFQRFLCNDLEQVTAKAFPEIAAIKAALIEAGAQGALMSGSGPTVFGLFESRDRAMMAREKLKLNQAYGVFLVRMLP